MHILTLTSLFPNPMLPVHAVFVRARMEAYVRYYKHAWTVVAPIPYFPKLPFKAKSRYGIYARIPYLEEPWGFKIYHPRYLVTPKIGMRYYGQWMSQGVRKTILALHKEKPFDIIDGHYIYPDGTAAIDLGKELGIPVILSARGTDLTYYPSFPSIAPMLQRNLADCKKLICVCTELKTVALKLGTPASKITVIGNGIDGNRFQAGDKIASRKALGLPLDSFLILSVGRLTPHKGFQQLIESFAQLDRKDLFLVLAGEGPQRRDLEQLARSLDISSRILFTGPIPNEALPAWYQSADLFVLASNREGWPNVLCEAQACGLPSLAVDAWGMPEIIHDARLGILVKSASVDELRLGLETALSKNWDREFIAKVGGSRTWESVAENLESVFQEAIRPQARIADR